MHQSQASISNRQIWSNVAHSTTLTIYPVVIKKKHLVCTREVTGYSLLNVSSVCNYQFDIFIQIYQMFLF